MSYEKVTKNIFDYVGYNAKWSKKLNKISKTSFFIISSDLDRNENCIYISGCKVIKNNSKIIHKPFIAKYDVSGKLLWHKVLELNNTNSYVNTIVTNRENNNTYIYCSINVDYEDNNAEVLLLKFDSDGNLVWGNEIMSNYIKSENLFILNDNIYMIGYERGYEPNKYNSRGFLAKFDTNSKLVYKKHVELENTDVFLNNAVVSLEDNKNYIFVSGNGTFISEDYIKKGLIFKFNEDGVVLLQDVLYNNQNVHITEIDINDSFIEIKGKNKVNYDSNEHRDFNAKMDFNNNLVDSSINLSVKAI